MSSSWHSFVKAYAHDHGLSYQQALATASPAYHEYKAELARITQAQVQADRATEERKIRKNLTMPDRPNKPKREKPLPSRKAKTMYQEPVEKPKPKKKVVYVESSSESEESEEEIVYKKRSAKRKGKEPAKKTKKVVYVESSDDDSE